MSWSLLQNSLLVSGAATALAVGIGLASALWLAGLDSGWRNRLMVLAGIALALPPFVVTNCWLDLLGTTGRWRAWLPWNIYSLGGAAWILALLTWPIPLLLVLAAWRRVEPAQLESDPALCGWPLIRFLLWPAARPAIGQAAVLTFVLTLNNFAVPAILQVKVLPAEVWVRFSTDLQPLAALAAGWPLIVGPGLLLLLLRRADLTWPHEQGPAGATAWRRQLGAGWRAFGAVATLLSLLLSVGLPLVQLLGSFRTWAELPNLLRAIPGVIGTSFTYAAVTATVCVAVGLGSWRLRLGQVLWLPLLVPGVLLGIALIALFNRPGFEPFYRSSGIVVLALAIRYLALGWNGVAQAMRTCDRDLADAARLEGAAGWMLFRHVRWPQIAPAVGAAWYVTYLLCLWDVETVVLIYPPGGETLALRVFNLLHYGHTAQVNAAALVLVALAVAPGAVWRVARLPVRVK